MPTQFSCPSKSFLISDPESPLYSRVEQVLGFLEAAEVILELTGSLAGGRVGKWVVVVVVQLIRREKEFS